MTTRRWLGLLSLFTLWAVSATTMLVSQAAFAYDRPSRFAAKTLPPLRQQYVDEVLQLKEVALASRGAGAGAEATARLLHAERNALKLKYRELSPADAVRKYEQRNIKLYGNPLGPTIDQLRAAGKSWDDIIESATRPGGGDLGF